MKFRKTLSIIIIICGIIFILGASDGIDQYGNIEGTGNYNFGISITLIGIIAYISNIIISNNNMRPN